jgi:membrane fusion protein (multidrug efflux system)
MKLKIVLSVGIVLLVLGVVGGIKAVQIKTLIATSKAMVPPPDTVSSFIAREEKWQGTINAIGSIVAVQGVTIAPELAGLVQEIAFESGAVVSKGDLLVRLDTSLERAQLSAIEAQVQLAVVNLQRVRTLSDQNMVSKADLDTAEATLKQYQGNAEAIRATIDKKTIRAPFNGRLGIRQVNLGQYLDTGKPIVSLQALTPIYVEFSLPQQELARLQTGMAVHLSTDAYPGREFEGKLTAINPDLDPTTRSVGLQATIENADKLLRPGMFARVEVLLKEQKSVVVIPATAVVTAPYGDSVYLIEPSKDEQGKEHLIARQQFIRTGPGRGDFISVETGLKPGQKVVSAGGLKLRNGATVTENNDLVPKPSEKPHPADA